MPAQASHGHARVDPPYQLGGHLRPQGYVPVAEELREALLDDVLAKGDLQSLGRCCAMPLGTAHLKLHPVLSMLLPALPTVAIRRYHFELQGPALWAELSERGNHLVF